MAPSPHNNKYNSSIYPFQFCLPPLGSPMIWLLPPTGKQYDLLFFTWRNGRQKNNNLKIIYIHRDCPLYDYIRVHITQTPQITSFIDTDTENKNFDRCNKKTYPTLPMILNLWKNPHWTESLILFCYCHFHLHIA